ncbi:ion transporter [Natronorubrum texcoconense]|uniref:Voltage-gated potassium channel n=1 Tax=Natronorubrum texcoconense TaxID=1095776 RepID=A0A1G8VMG9_9EURY|nr:ion transporter [Natronorubrum texcoconense]SDJ67241.1 voltage-gated potassium channel [Natronorubrum texcoconense]
MVTGSLRPVKERVYILLDGGNTEDRLSLGTNLFITALIVLNVGTYIAGTVDWVGAQYGWYIYVFDIICVGVFTIEYVLRVWSCTVDDRYSSPIRGRIRFMLSPYALVDLFAILPFYLPVVIGEQGAERVLRIFRLFRLLKIARYSSSTTLITNVFRRKSHELMITVLVMSIWLVFISSLMYYIERSAQPEVFSSIPAAIWWGVVTLTTVGYGDVVPVTPLGRALGATIALLGIGLFALPAGIIASGFTEELNRRRQGDRYCPHCGEHVDELADEPQAHTEKAELDD